MFQIYFQFFDSCRQYINNDLYKNAFKSYMECTVKFNCNKCVGNAVALLALNKLLENFCAEKGYYIEEFLHWKSPDALLHSNKL